MRSTWLVLAAIGCKGPTGPVPVLDPACPDDAPVAGVEGGSAVDTVQGRWAYSRTEEMSWADPIYFQLPDDITGLSVTVDAGDAATGIAGLALDGLTVLDWTNQSAFLDAARRRVDTWDSGGADTAWYPTGDGWGSDPLYHWPTPAGTVQLPLNLDTTPWAGCLAVLPVAAEDQRKADMAVHVATKRTGREADRMDVNVVLVDGAGITEAEVTEAVDHAAALYVAGGGLTLGEVTFETITLEDGPYVRSSGPGLGALRRSGGASFGALNLYFIADFLGEAGTLGIAAGIPGALVPGTAGSGVTMSVETHLLGDGTVDTTLLGETIAHEGGHQLGLFHTIEADGWSHDIIGDTPECTTDFDTDGDGEMTAEECADQGGRNFMFWTAGEFSQDEMSETQATVLDLSPLAQ